MNRGLQSDSSGDGILKDPQAMRIAIVENLPGYNETCEVFMDHVLGLPAEKLFFKL